MSTPLPPPPPPPQQQPAPPPPPPSPRHVTPSPPPASAAPQPFTRAKKVAIAVCSVAALAGAIALFWAIERSSRPSGSQLSVYFEQKLGHGLVRFADVDFKVVDKSRDYAELDVSARASTREALYREADTNTILRQRGYDPATLAATKALLKSRDGGRLQEWAGLPALPADPSALHLLHQTAAAGEEATFSCIVNARKNGGRWDIQMSNGRFSSDAFDGRPRRAFGEALVENDPTDQAKIDAMIAAIRDYSEKLSAAAQQFRQKLAEERRTRLARITQTLTPGALYSGIARSRANGEGAVLYLELTSVSDNPRTLGANVRNDSGGSEYRAFQGDWRTDEETGTVHLRLATRPNQRAQQAGPILDDWSGWTIDFELAEDGKLTGRSETLDYEFQRVPEPDLPRVRKEMLQGQERLFAAVAPKRFYLGSITSRSSGASVPSLLQFQTLEPKTGAFAGTFQSLSRSSNVRAFTGLAIGNKYRADNHPLRLEIRGARGVGEFYSGNWDSRANFTLENDELRGSSGDYEFAFKPATDAELAEIEQRRQSAAAAFFAIVRAGVAYDGTARNQEGFVGRLRIRVEKLDELERTATFIIESRDQPGLYARFSGAYSVEDRTVVATSNDGRINKSGVRKVPFLTHDDTYRIRLTAHDGRLDGTIEAGMHAHGWALEFPLPRNQPATATRLTPTATDAPAGMAGFPALPSADGAYVLVNDQWVKLPRNNSRVTYGAAQVVGGILQGLSALSGKPVNDRTPDKLADLTFDGSDAVPRANKQSVIILYRGAISRPSAVDITKYPELGSYPCVEVAPLRTGSDGKRRADLLRIVPGIAGFRENRITCTLDEIDPALHLLTATAELDPGRYAVAAGTNAFEVEIE